MVYFYPIQVQTLMMLPDLGTVIRFFEVFALLYLVGINIVYLMLSFLSLRFILRYTAEHEYKQVPPVYLNFAPAISVIVPAYNEANTIITSIKSLFNLMYPEYEIIVVNDGSTDTTLDVLKQEYDLEDFPEAYRQSIPCELVRRVYMSRKDNKLRVVDKVNGGKADALNAGVNASRYPLVCFVDADSILQPDSLIRVSLPFMEDPTTVATGGIVRIVNGCSLGEDGIVRPGLPKSWLALFQVVEYLRAFLFGRIGWSNLNAVLIISGAFGLFRKDILSEIGGFDTKTVGEDMELVVRLHEHMKLANQPYKITFVPDPICWTEVPEDFKNLRNQRVRWHQGLAESLSKNFNLCFHPKSGYVGWLAFPFMLFCELLSPVIELVSFIFIVIGLYLGFVTPQVFAAIVLVIVGISLILSMTTLLLEEMSYHLYSKPSEVIRLVLAIVLENIGYRQITLYWRIIGLLHWMFGRREYRWPDITRRGVVRVTP